MNRSISILAIAIPVAAGLAQSSTSASVRIQPERLEGQPFNRGPENQQQGDVPLLHPRSCLPGRSMVVSGEGHGWFGRQIIGQRRNLIRHQFLDLVQAGHGDSPGKFGIRRRRANRKSVGPQSMTA